MTANSRVPAGAAIRHFTGASSGGEIIAEFRKNQREVCRVVRRTFKGHQLVYVRVWFDDADTGERPPGKGVSLEIQILTATVGILSSLIGGTRGPCGPTERCVRCNSSARTATSAS